MAVKNRRLRKQTMGLKSESAGGGEDVRERKFTKKPFASSAVRKAKRKVSKASRKANR